jgi:hypothetical protein
MFRNLSRPLCAVPLSRLSARATCFQPLVQASALHLKTLQLRNLTILNWPRVSDRLRLGPRWHPIHQHLSQAPHVIGPSRRHCRCAWPPPLHRAAAMGRFRNSQRLPPAGVGQHNIGGDLLHRQRLPHASLALTEGMNPTPPGGHALAHVQVQSVTVGRRVTPPTTAPKRRMKLSPHAAPQYLDACHAYPAGDSLDAPAFSPHGSVHGALANAQSARRGDCHCYGPPRCGRHGGRTAHSHDTGPAAL